MNHVTKSDNVFMDSMLTDLNTNRKKLPQRQRPQQPICDIHPCEGAPVARYLEWEICEAHDRELQEMKR